MSKVGCPPKAEVRGSNPLGCARFNSKHRVSRSKSLIFNHICLRSRDHGLPRKDPSSGSHGARNTVLVGCRYSSNLGSLVNKAADSVMKAAAVNKDPA